MVVKSHQIFLQETKLWKLDLNSEIFLNTLFKRVLSLQQKEIIKIKQPLKKNLQKKLNLKATNLLIFCQLLIKVNLILMNLAKLSKKVLKKIEILRFDLRKYLNQLSSWELQQILIMKSKLKLKLAFQKVQNLMKNHLKNLSN